MVSATIVKVRVVKVRISKFELRIGGKKIRIFIIFGYGQKKTKKNEISQAYFFMGKLKKKCSINQKVMPHTQLV